MVWDWAVGGITDEVPRTIGPECENYLTNRRRIIESILFCILFACVIKWAYKRLEPIQIPDAKETDKRYTPTRIALMLIMTIIFGIELGFKLANRSVIFVLNPCHIQTIVQIYLLAAKPNRFTTTMFRIQMNNLNGPLLAFVFPEVECRTLPFEQAAYWIQHAMLYIIPVYILRTGAYKAEDLHDYNWSIIGVELQLIYHFSILNYFSMITGVNLNHMLCAAESDPFQGEYYRIAAVIHESILCPILNKLTVYTFATPQSIQFSTKRKIKHNHFKPTTTTTTAIATTITTATTSSSSSSSVPHQTEQYEKLTMSSSAKTTSLSSTMPRQKHKPPNINNQLYLNTDAPSNSNLSSSNSNSSGSSSSHLLHRNSMPASGEYHQKTSTIEKQPHYRDQHHQHQHHTQHPLQDEAVYSQEHDDNMEVVEASQLPPSAITTEYRMPTTKID